MNEIDLSRVDLNLLTVFDALMREGHVGRAGERLRLTQPAVSHALARLRHLLGDPLFVRHAKGVKPTPRAEELALPLAAALQGLRALLAPRLPFDPRGVQRTITLGTTDYVSFVVLPSLMAMVRREAPGLDLRVHSVDSGSVLQRLRRGEVDLAIGPVQKAPATLEVVPLFLERLVAVARRGHPALGGKLSIADFAALPHLLVSPGGDAHGLVDEALTAHGLARRIVLTVPHFLAVPFLVEATDLVAALAERVATRLAATAAIEIGPLPVEAAPWTVGMIRPKGAVPDPALTWFMNAVAATARSP